MDSKAKRRLFGIVALAFFVLALSMIITGAVLPEWIEVFGVTPGRAGRLFFLFYLTYIITTFLSGILGDRFGKKPILVIGQACLAGGFLVVGTAPTFHIVEIGMLLLGLGGGCSEAPFTTLVSEVFAGREGSALNLSQVSFGVGAAAGPFLAGYLLDVGMSWRFLYLVPGAVSLFLLSMLGRERTLFKAEKATFSLREVPVLFRKRGFFLALSFAVMILYVGAEIGSSSWISTYVVRELGGSIYQGGLALAGFWGMITVGRLVFAGLARHYSYQGLLRFSAALSLGFLLLLLPAQRVELAIGAFMGVGLGYSAIWPLIVAVVARGVDTMKMTAISLVVAFGGIGALTFPWLLGIFSERGGFRVIFPVVVFLVIAMGVLLFSPRFNENERSEI